MLNPWMFVLMILCVAAKMQFTDREALTCSVRVLHLCKCGKNGNKQNVFVESCLRIINNSFVCLPCPDACLKFSNCATCSFTRCSSCPSRQSGLLCEIADYLSSSPIELNGEFLSKDSNFSDVTTDDNQEFKDSNIYPVFTKTKVGYNLLSLYSVTSKPNDTLTNFSLDKDYEEREDTIFPTTKIIAISKYNPANFFNLANVLKKEVTLSFQSAFLDKRDISDHTSLSYLNEFFKNTSTNETKDNFHSDVSPSNHSSESSKTFDSTFPRETMNENLILHQNITNDNVTAGLKSPVQLSQSPFGLNKDLNYIISEMETTSLKYIILNDTEINKDLKSLQKSVENGISFEIGELKIPLIDSISRNSFKYSIEETSSDTCEDSYEIASNVRKSLENTKDKFYGMFHENQSQFNENKFKEYQNAATPEKETIHNVILQIKDKNKEDGKDNLRKTTENEVKNERNENNEQNFDSISFASFEQSQNNSVPTLEFLESNESVLYSLKEENTSEISTYQPNILKDFVKITEYKEHPEWTPSSVVNFKHMISKRYKTSDNNINSIDKNFPLKSSEEIKIVPNSFIEPNEYYEFLNPILITKKKSNKEASPEPDSIFLTSNSSVSFTTLSPFKSNDTKLRHQYRSFHKPTDYNKFVKNHESNFYLNLFLIYISYCQLHQSNPSCFINLNPNFSLYFSHQKRNKTLLQIKSMQDLLNFHETYFRDQSRFKEQIFPRNTLNKNNILMEASRQSNNSAQLNSLNSPIFSGPIYYQEISRQIFPKNIYEVINDADSPRNDIYFRFPDFHRLSELVPYKNNITNNGAYYSQDITYQKAHQFPNSTYYRQNNNFSTAKIHDHKNLLIKIHNNANDSILKKGKVEPFEIDFQSLEKKEFPKKNNTEKDLMELTIHPYPLTLVLANKSFQTPPTIQERSLNQTVNISNRLLSSKSELRLASMQYSHSDINITNNKTPKKLNIAGLESNIRQSLSTEAFYNPDNSHLDLKKFSDYLSPKNTIITPKSGGVNSTESNSIQQQDRSDKRLKFILKNVKIGKHKKGKHRKSHSKVFITNAYNFTKNKKQVPNNMLKISNPDQVPRYTSPSPVAAELQRIELLKNFLPHNISVAKIKYKNSIEEEVYETFQVYSESSDDGTKMLDMSESPKNRTRRDLDDVWCSLLRKTMHGELECRIWSYEKICSLSCHSGFESRQTMFTCIRSMGEWVPPMTPCEKAGDKTSKDLDSLPPDSIKPFNSIDFVPLNESSNKSIEKTFYQYLEKNNSFLNEDENNYDNLDDEGIKYYQDYMDAVLNLEYVFNVTS